MANAGNAPIDHLARRRAPPRRATRSTRRSLGTQSLTRAYKNVGRRLGHQGRGSGRRRRATPRPTATSIINGTFTTNGGDDRRQEEVVAAGGAGRPRSGPTGEVEVRHAPARRQGGRRRLRAARPPACWKSASRRRRSRSRGKGTVTFTADCRLDRSAGGIAAVRVLDRQPTADDLPALARRLIDPKNPVTARFAASGASVLPAVPQPLLLRRCHARPVGRLPPDRGLLPRRPAAVPVGAERRREAGTRPAVGRAVLRHRHLGEDAARLRVLRALRAELPQARRLRLLQGGRPGPRQGRDAGALPGRVPQAGEREGHRR